jgi:hypothetical protein
MRGKLKYYDPIDEIGYGGGWFIKLPDMSFNNTFRPCDETIKWIEQNNPPKEIDVEFTVFCDCHYDEETNKATHGLLAKIENVKFK